MSAVGAVALDANVLVPIVACDFLLTAFDHGLFEPVVSAAVLDEVERTLLEDFPHIDPAGLRRRVGYLRLALADHVVDTIGVDVPEAITFLRLVAHLPWLLRQGGADAPRPPVGHEDTRYLRPPLARQRRRIQSRR